MDRIVDFVDVHGFQDALDDQDALMLPVEIRRCHGINRKDGYPGETPEILRRSIFTCAEFKPVTLGENESHGGIHIVGDLEIRIGYEIRGSNQKDWEYGDKINPDTVADIVVVSAPYQGEWYVVGIPEPAQIGANQAPLFWNANIRRIRRGAIGK